MKQDVVEDVWAAQMKFGMTGATFVPYWEQKEFASSDPEVRISLWSKPGTRLIVLSNFTDRDRKVQLRLASGAKTPQYAAAWKAADLSVTDGVATLTIPAKRGALLTATLPAGL